MRINLVFIASLSFNAALVTPSQSPDPADRNPFAGDPASVEAGERIFRQACATCHSDPDRAPSLREGGWAHGEEDGEIFQNIRTGIDGTEMPPFLGLSSDEIWQVVAFLRGPSVPGTGRSTAPTTSGTGGDAAAGEVLFNGKGNCVSCHRVNGTGGIVGPDLSTAGVQPAAALRQKILTPNNPGDPGGARPRRNGAPQTVIARTADGREIRGVRRHEDTFSLHMVDASGRLHLLDKRQLRDVRIEKRSLMPGNFATLLTPSELDNLVAYLGTLEERDPGQIAAATIFGGITYERLRDSRAEPRNWLHYWGDYQGTHYSRLDDITPANVPVLQAQWAIQLPGPSPLQATPLVVDGIMYTSGSPGTVVALDARTGRQIWRHHRPQKVRNPYEINLSNRGVAVLGHRVFFGTLDAALVALDARTGAALWETEVADTRQGYSITSAPLVVKDKLIVGVSGGEFATRGFLDAYDPVAGTRLWRFYTIPGTGELGNETWKGDSWKTGGGATWLTGSYDPDLDLLYWTVGNPAAQIDRSVRGDGDNLFSDSVVALDPDTGERQWHYQFTPNDGHDWDSCQDVILVDRVWRGEKRKLLLHADRNGFFYVLDRTNGTFLSATPFVYQNWNQGFDATGRPIQVPGSNSSSEGSFFVYPTLGGGTNFQAPSYSPITGWMYLEYSENGQRYVSAPVANETGRQYLGWGSLEGGRGAPGPGEPAPSAGIKALDAETGATMWDFKISRGSLSNGVLATAGGFSLRRRARVTCSRSTPRPARTCGIFKRERACRPRR